MCGDVFMYYDVYIMCVWFGTGYLNEPSKESSDTLGELQVYSYSSCLLCTVACYCCHFVALTCSLAIDA